MNYSAPDVLLFKELTSTGQFYEYLMERFNIPQTPEDRNKFKKEFFGKIFYSRIHEQWEYAYAKQFRALFPTVYEAILWHKREDHASLPNRLQRNEADIIVKGVCNRIVIENSASKRPFFISVHDCIVCVKKDIDSIKSLIEDELKKMLGFTPKIKAGLF